MTSPYLSIIIPTLNEGALLAALISSLRGIPCASEIIVVDGGSRDDTLDIARSQADVAILQQPPGRAAQMNAGAARARGEVLWFVHADSHLTASPQGYAAVLQAVKSWGFFPLSLSGDAPTLIAVAWLINQRSRLSSVATGDQGLFMRRGLFLECGGFADLPLMEDVEMSKRLRACHPPLVADLPLGTSSRRWERDGVLRTVLLMWRLRFLYFIGVSPITWHRPTGPMEASAAMHKHHTPVRCAQSLLTALRRLEITQGLLRLRALPVTTGYHRSETRTHASRY